jgi:hypothetical protein
MRNILFVFFLGGSIALNAQVLPFDMQMESKQIFSFANVERPSAVSASAQTLSTRLRWAPVFNYTIQPHFNLSNSFGVFTGLEIKNTGFIIEQGGDTVTKHRTYNLGIPVFLKLGNLADGIYIFAGAGYDYQFDYKEKIFVGDSRTKRKPSNAVNQFVPYLSGGFAYQNYFISVTYQLDDYFKEGYAFESLNGSKSAAYTKSQLLMFNFGVRQSINDDESSTSTNKTQQTYLHY